MITNPMASNCSHVISYNDGNLYTLVEVAGEFSKWAKLPLTSEANDTLYSRVIEGLKPGHSYMYKFVVDGKWLLASDGRPLSIQYYSHN